ncbi:GntR family transcriptional regulator [Paraburkholderia sp. Ac-20336]|uniref:GntR family transcriptional regulator n=1 Tax=Burkholderiaceae TaxID=119060 RepID=UPI0014209F91|nr:MULTISPECIES: GntR family transcriptional regulator [Burkholderiaceae]MBN3801536.1 GntR family transcriptional regulator [Paraburkholderia sp. Ac-20336]MBN3846625.1 GntR family transcriptional regulator [Paraburkholderia sp. Ac-20342]NIF55710.1 GntR family transcriptional regulator [Burkholderia sp. Ax-1724]NIF78033.1 GntR family transcriptional regulator [Paraburkholderia sp. Cy-641]
MTTEKKSLRIEREVKTLRQLALERMRNAILQSHFLPGERLVERPLCDELGVSRTVVREVLRHLETEGLVENIANLGPVVKKVDLDEAIQIYEIRALLEGSAARACAEKSTPEIVAYLSLILDAVQEAFRNKDYDNVLLKVGQFYEYMFGSGGKTVAWKLAETLNARINQLRAHTIRSPGRDKASFKEMKKLLDAIEAKDGAAAERASVEHVQAVIRILVDSQSKRDAADEPAATDLPAPARSPARPRRQNAAA